MKRLSVEQKKRLRRHQKLAWASKLSEKRKRAQRRIMPDGEVVVERHGVRSLMRATPSGALPANFCLEQNYDETISFLNRMRFKMDERMLEALQGGRPIKGIARQYFDLVPVQRMSPAAVLMFAAEYDCALALLPDWKLVTYDAPRWNPEVRELLEQIGFFQLLSIQLPAHVSPGNMRMTRFSQSEGTGNAEAASLLTQVANLLGIGIQSDDLATEAMGQYRLFDALIEATENTRLHAYDLPTPTPELTVKRWWMTGAVDRAEGKLTTVVYDRGATIPATLPRSTHWGSIQRALKRLFGVQIDSRPDYDSVSLRLAMSSGASSSGKEHRGKGLMVLKRVVDECDRGRLQVISRYGKYVYERGRKPVYTQLPIPLSGTLIQWDLWRPEWIKAA